MKRRLVSLILAAMVTISLSSNVLSASNPISNQSKAEKLNALGMLQGTGAGFELEKSVTRAEGSVMLIRLLGKETEALTGTYLHPFKDVPAWADPFVGYLYQNHLAFGMSATQFGSDSKMTANQYATFVLRTLGYDDSCGDFNWNEAVSMAYNIGLITAAEKDRLSGNAVFLRDDMVGMSYNALETKINGSAKTLAEQLVNQGTFSQQKAVDAGVLAQTPQEIPAPAQDDENVPEQPDVPSPKPPVQEASVSIIKSSRDITGVGKIDEYHLGENVVISPDLNIELLFISGATSESFNDPADSGPNNSISNSAKEHFLPYAKDPASTKMLNYSQAKRYGNGSVTMSIASPKLIESNPNLVSDASSQALISDLKFFAEKTQAAGFFAENVDAYNKMIQNFVNKMQEMKVTNYIKRLEEFYGVKKDAVFRVMPSPIMTGGQALVMKDASGGPVFINIINSPSTDDESLLNILYHETNIYNLVET